MRREVIIAIILGVGLGVAVAFGVWRANIALSSKSSQANSLAQVNQNSQGDIPNSSDLLVSSPEDNSITSTESVIIKGSAVPKAIVVISSNVDNEIVQADTSGSFEKQITVDGGPNQIVVKSYDEQGNESQQKITVVYSTEFQE
jgi:hypothetical protein